MNIELPELKPCPFCGARAELIGQETRDCVNGIWAAMPRTEYFVRARCFPACVYGNTHARAFGVVGGIRYSSPEAAAAAWNTRLPVAYLEETARRWELDAECYKSERDESREKFSKLYDAYQNALRMRKRAYDRLCDWCGVCPPDKRDISSCEIANLDDELTSPDNATVQQPGPRPTHDEDGQLLYYPSDVAIGDTHDD